MRCFTLSWPSALAHFTLYASAWLSFAAGAAETATHLVFPVPGHPDWPQTIVHKTFALNQSVPQAFRYGTRIKCRLDDPHTPPSHSLCGMECRVVYADGKEKWIAPPAPPSPARADWQAVGGTFVPPRPVAEVTVYARLARPGEVWVEPLAVTQFAPAAAREPCSCTISNDLVQLENAFIRLTLDPSCGGAAVACVTKTNGLAHASRRNPWGAEAPDGRTRDASAWRLVRTRSTPETAEAVFARTGFDGFAFLEIEKTYRLARDLPGVEVERTYRALPAAMSDLRVWTDDGATRLAVPLAGAVTRRARYFAPDGSATAPGTAYAAAARPFALTLSRELVTPHTPFLAPLAGGRLRVLFLLDIRQQREIVELAQRLELDFDTVRIAYNRDDLAWGMVERYGTYDFDDANAALAEKLARGRYDAVVVSGRVWERVNDANRAALARAQSAGTGLVAIGTRAGIPADAAPDVAGTDAVTRGIPSALLPYGADRATAFAWPAGARAVQLDYDAADGLTPFVPFADCEPAFAYADYALARVARAVCWAAGRTLQAPSDAAQRVTEERTADGLVIRRTQYVTSAGVADFACTVTAGDPARARVAPPPWPAADVPWPEVPFAMGESAHRCGRLKRYLMPLRYAQLKSAGVNQMRFWHVDPPETYRPYLPYGFGLQFPVAGARLENFAAAFQAPYARTHDRRYLRRTPCLNDPDFLAREGAAIASRVAGVRQLRPQVYDAGDENSLTRWEAAFDFCFAPHCLAAFRAFLRGEYASLAALNGVWGTDFASWDEVTPDTAEEARARAARTGRRSYAAWADHRRFMERTFCGYLDGVRRTIAGVDPGRRFDISGTQPANGYTGMDYWRLAQIVDLPALYDLENTGEIVRSFRTFAHPWYGYGASAAEIRWQLWRDAFRYLDFGISYYHEGLMLRPDYTLSEPVAAAGEIVREWRTGAARLLRALASDPAVLVHYSHASAYAAQIEGRYREFAAARDFWVQRLVATATPFRFVAYAEIEAGELRRTTARTVVLPESAALSDAEAAELAAFAARGGKIVARGPTGLFDGHCAARPRPALAGRVTDDDGLGVSATDGIRTFAWRLRAGGPVRYWGFVRNLEPSGAAPAARTQELSAPGYVYDLRRGGAPQYARKFTVALAPGEAAFFAVLPYRVTGLSATASGEVRLAVSEGVAAYHPVHVAMCDAAGRICTEEVIDVHAGRGLWHPPSAPVAAVVFTDYISKNRFVLTNPDFKRSTP